MGDKTYFAARFDRTLERERLACLEASFATGTHPYRRMASLGMQFLRDRVVGPIFESDKEMDALLGVLADRSLLSGTPTLVAVWGRKPL
jgi:hypothetical protein